MHLSARQPTIPSTGERSRGARLVAMLWPRKSDCTVTEPGWRQFANYLKLLAGEVAERSKAAVLKADQAVSRNLRESNGLRAATES